jgi:DNA-binding response OmpR family regulator
MYSLSSRPAQDGIQILMITDDSKLNLSLMQAGYRVMPASCGVEALAKFQTHTIDLVVLDMMTPQTDGLALCQQLRDGSDVPIILLTHNQTDTIVRGLEIGADDAITHPVTSLDLTVRIEALMHRLQRMAALRNASSNQRMNKGYLVMKDRAHPEYAPPSPVPWMLANGYTQRYEAFNPCPVDALHSSTGRTSSPTHTR